jgi:hypothetical protein
MTFKSVFATALLAASAFAGSAQATPWTFSLQGTVNWGTDDVGLFGAAGESLVGAKYTQTITADTDPSIYHPRFEPEDPTYSLSEHTASLFGVVFPSETNTVFKESITINGKTLNFSFSSLVVSGQTISNGGLKHEAGWYNTLYSSLEGETDDHYYLYATNVVGSPDPDEIVIPAPDFGQTLTGTQRPNNGFYDTGLFVLFDNDSSAVTHLDLTPESFRINADAPTDVPEPASLALLGLGALGLGAMSRKRAPC